MNEVTLDRFGRLEAYFPELADLLHNRNDTAAFVKATFRISADYTASEMLDALPSVDAVKIFRTGGRVQIFSKIGDQWEKTSETNATSATIPANAPTIPASRQDSKRRSKTQTSDAQTLLVIPAPVSQPTASIPEVSVAEAFDYEQWWEELRRDSREKLLRDHCSMSAGGAQSWASYPWLRLKLAYRFWIESAMNFHYTPEVR